MLEQPMRLVKQEVKGFTILKSDDLIIGGYASIEMVDKQNDLITLKALEDAVKGFMENKKFRNVMSNHSNVQVGEVVEREKPLRSKAFESPISPAPWFLTHEDSRGSSPLVVG